MNAPGNPERLRFLVKIVQRESLHLRATDERLFASPLTPERLQSMDTDDAKAEQLDAFVARFARLQDTVGDKFVPALLQELQEPHQAATRPPALPADHLQDHQALLAAEVIRAGQRAVFRAWLHQLSLDQHARLLAHQWQHPDVERGSDRVPDRAGVRANHRTDVSM